LKGFTLSELLVALTVLGLISAMTLPTLFNNVDTGKQKALAKELVTTLQSTFLEMWQQGEISGSESVANENTPFVQALLRRLNVATVCPANVITPPCDTRWGNNPPSSALYNNMTRLILQGGSVVWLFDATSSEIRVLIDINGATSPPNSHGNGNLSGNDQNYLRFNIKNPTATMNGRPWRPGELRPSDNWALFTPTYDYWFS
jgi:prepilin-type N-terminal cleavage/methylation domain-containing protein